MFIIPAKKEPAAAPLTPLPPLIVKPTQEEVKLDDKLSEIDALLKFE
jgi:hypothetical protein